MKKLGIIIAIISCFGISTATAQEGTSDTTSVENPDTVKLSWGAKKILIISTGDDGGDTVKISKEKRKRYNHYAGLDLGINGYLNSSNSTNLGASEEFMDLNYGKSVEVGLNFYEKFMPIAKEKFGIVTGLGIRYNNYDIDRDVVIINQNDMTIGVIDSARSIKKNKFKSTFLEVPLMLETNLGKDADHSFHLSLGGTVGYRLASKTKQKYSQDGDDFKKKDRNDFNINPFRFSAVARVGYGSFTMYAAYSLNPLFEDNKGPELYPFTIGISLISF